MAISPDQQALLEAPFKPDEHGFNGSSQAYILKHALRQRLNKIDPHWSTGAPEVLSADEALIVIRLPLTIHGATRYGVGACAILRADKNGNKFEGLKLAQAVAKAFKHAVSDALPRAAIEFNCGAYLKAKPQSVGKDDFPGWLAKLTAPHWANNGGRERIAAWLDGAGFTWAVVKDQIEPGRTLERLNDTTLTEVQLKERLRQVKADLLKPASSKVETAVQSHPAGTEPTPQRLGADNSI